MKKSHWIDESWHRSDRHLGAFLVCDAVHMSVVNSGSKRPGSLCSWLRHEDPEGRKGYPFQSAL